MAWKMMTNRLATPHHYDVCQQNANPSAHRITEYIIELCGAKSRNIQLGEDFICKFKEPHEGIIAVFVFLN